MEAHKDLIDLWPMILQVHGRINQAMPSSVRESLMAMIGEYNAEPGHVFHLIYMVENFNPDQLSIAHYRRRDPFDHPSVVAGFLAACTAVHLLTTNEDGTYRLTETGHQVRQRRWQLVNDALAQVDFMPEAESEHLLFLLQKTVEATAVAPLPAWAFHTRRNQGLKPPLKPIAPPMQFIEYRFDLGAYRDDAHLAAWQDKYDVSPLAWELLTEIWNGRAHTPNALTKNLARRGYEKHDYTTALDDLVQRGWLAMDDHEYRLTENGRLVRETAEQQTNDNFYAPWSVLSDEEVNELRQSLLNMQQ